MSSPLRDLPAPNAEGYLSTRDVAHHLSVSEATVKRWTDEGLIACKRTPGGHRKFRREDVLEFMRTHHLTDPEKLPPLPALTPDQVIRIGLTGDGRALHRLLVNALNSGTTLSSIMDDFIAPALLEVGERWACAGLSVAEEHLVSSTISDVLMRLADEYADKSERGIAVGACLSDERHDIGLRMATVILRARGFRVLSTGADTPAADVARLTTSTSARLLVLSGILAANRPSDRLAELMHELRGRPVQIVVGGPAFAALTQLPAGTRLATSMRQLEAIVDEVARTETDVN